MIARLICMVMLLLPGLAGLALAILADLGPLEGSGGMLSAPRILLLLAAAGVLGWGGFVHFKAQRDCESQDRAYFATVVLLSVPTVLSVGLAVWLTEAAAGMLPAPHTSGLIFPPNSSATMRTSEFACKASINALGIRDSAIAGEKKGLRILAIGDSFTYGWGVNDGEAWPEVLERHLRQTHPDAEVVNLGAPGAGPRDYALLARRAVPQLQPDLVVVAVVQGDDLAQLHFETGKSNATSLQAMLEQALPNLFGRLNRLASVAPREIQADALKATWQAQAAGMTASFGPEQQRRYDALDPTARQLLRRGDVNPGLIHTAICRPDWFQLTMEPERPAAAEAVAEMAQQLDAVGQVSESWEAEMLVLCLPLGPYTDARLMHSRRRLGFQVDESMLRSSAPDRTIEAACEQAGLACYSCTEAFRQDARVQRLYYEIDGHFNRWGQARFGAFAAEVIEPHAARHLTTHRLPTAPTSSRSTK